MITNDNEEAEGDITPDLEEFDSENDNDDHEHTTLNQILQKISDCKRDFNYELI